MAKSKVVKLTNKKGEKTKGRKRFPAVAKGKQQPLVTLPFLPARSLHPKFAAMFLDCNISISILATNQFGKLGSSSQDVKIPLNLISHSTVLFSKYG